jgi:hypothetical protein
MNDCKKWKNPDVDRMVETDQKELFKDKKNMSLILPSEQQEHWRQKQLICTLVAALQQEMTLNQQWAIYDMRGYVQEFT